MSFSVTLDLLFVIAVIGGVLALVDGIIRVRGRGSSIIAVIEIIAAALFLLSLFVSGIPLGSFILAVILVILLVLQLVLRGSTRRGSIALTVIALVLLVVWAVLERGWIVIPGLNG